MPEGTMYIEKAAPVGRVVLNLPDVHNPMSEAFRNDMEAALTIMRNDTTISAVILKANGKGTSAGGDLNFVAANFGGEVYHDRQTCLRLARWFYRVLWQFQKPLVFQVHGFLLGGSLALAACSDVMIVAEDARIGIPEARALGFEPLLGFWAMNIGARWTKLLLYTGDLIDGKTAAEIGIATKAVPADQLETYTEWLANRIAQVGWETLSIQKEAVNAAFEIMGFEAMIKSTAIHNHLSHGTTRAQEFRRRLKTEGIRAAADWRDVPFGGRTRMTGDTLPLLDGPPGTKQRS
jgi:enoyl-CoA hydratase